MEKEDKEKITDALENEKSVDDELYRQLDTMERNDLIELVISYMGEEDKKNFVKEWNNY